MGSFGGYAAQDFTREAAAQDDFYREQIRRFDDALADNDGKIKALERRRADSLQAFARGVCGEFTAQALGEAASKIGLPAIASLEQEREAEERKAQSALARLEADERFQKREALLAPQTGVIPAQIAELEPLRGEARNFIARLGASEGFEGLIARNYGLSSYPHQGLLRFLSPEYHADARNAGLLVNAFKTDSFAELRSQYDATREQIRSLDVTLGDLCREAAEIQRLAQEHAETLQTLERLPALYWERLGTLMYRHLQDAGATALQRFVGEDKEKEERYKRLDGLEHQIEYLQALSAKIAQDRAALVAKSGALKEEAWRYRSDPHRFRNKRWTEEQFRKKFNRDAGRYDRSLHRYQNASTTVYVFEDYGRVSLWEEFLWWDVMTDGRLDGNFIPETQTFYNSHPDYSYERSDFADGSDFADNS